jgi:hypothetical protein
VPWDTTFACAGVLRGRAQGGTRTRRHRVLGESDSSVRASAAASRQAPTIAASRVAAAGRSRSGDCQGDTRGSDGGLSSEVRDRSSHGRSGRKLAGQDDPVRGFIAHDHENAALGAALMAVIPPALLTVESRPTGLVPAARFITPAAGRRPLFRWGTCRLAPSPGWGQHVGPGNRKTSRRTPCRGRREELHWPQRLGWRPHI